MDPKTVTADEGWHWFVCGWGLFTRSPGVLIGELIVLLAISILLGLVPLIGGLVVALITPILAGGWFHTIRRLDNAEPAKLGDLFEGFRNKAWTRPLLILGVAVLAAQIVTALIAVAFLGTQFMTGASTDQLANLEVSLGVGVLLALFLAVLVMVVVFTALFYAIPLVIFQETAPVEAMESSLRVSLRNWLPLLVFGLVYLVLAFLAAIPFGLGFLVLVPVSVCGIYCSYKSIYNPFSEPADPAPALE